VQATGDAVGVYGLSNSNGGTGVHGQSSNSTGTNYGVRGINTTINGAGVWGENSTAGGTGVRGEATATSGSNSYGVYGNSAATSGVNYGVYGKSASPDGYAVYGHASATTGQNVGVYGYTSSSTGTGVFGISSQSTGYAGKFVGNVYVGDPNQITSVKAKVEINDTAGNFNLSTFGAYGATLASSGYSTSANTTGPNSIWASGRITALDFVAFSDERMKQIEGRSDTARDLVTLAGIEVTDYTYIDTVTKGVGEQKKVIAQQVETVYPQAVSRSTDVVPDIYQQAPIKAGWVELATDLQPGERVRLIGEKNQGVYEVLDVAPNGFRTDFVADGKAVFVYGREVDDFRSVDYEAIAMLNVSATQELNHLVEQQAAEIEALNIRLAALEQAVSSGNVAARAESNVPLTPWLLLAGLGVVGLVVVQKRRTG
jgi:hypothetical protein